MRSACAWLIVVGVAGGCSPKREPPEDPTVIATVNGEVIARADFEQALAREAQAMEGAPRTPEQVAPYKQALLDTLIVKALLLQAGRAAGVTVTSEEVDRRVLALSSEYPTGTFDQALAQSQTSRAALIRSTREALLVEKLFQQEVFSRIAVTEAQIRRSFEEHADEFVEPEQVHGQQLVVRGLDEAKRIQQQLWQGKKFADLARRYSLSADAKVGGDLGVFTRGELPPAFDEVMFRLAPGSTSEVVSTEYGYHLFRVLEKKPARKRELAEVRGVIEQRLLAQLRTDAQRDYTEALKAKATIKVNRSTLEATTVRPMVVPSAPEP